MCTNVMWIDLVDLIAVIELVKKGTPQIHEDVRRGPFAQPSVDSALGAVPCRQFAPWSTCPEDPQDTLKALAVVCGRTPAFCAPFASWESLLNELPLCICHPRQAIEHLRDLVS
jgi:hypothetical protein